MSSVTSDNDDSRGRAESFDSIDELEHDVQQAIIDGGIDTDGDDDDEGESESESESEEEEEEEEEEDEEEEEEEDEFTCENCSTVQGKNNCERCDVEDVCEECYGEGGDYGPGEIWVCHECLPTCLECEAPLYTASDECCGKGRSDKEQEQEEPCKYVIIPNYNVVEKAHWCTAIASDKIVTIIQTTEYRDSMIHAMLTEQDAEDIVQLNNIELNDYDIEIVSMGDGYAGATEIKDRELYTTDEIIEIICRTRSPGEHGCYDMNIDRDCDITNEPFCEETMDANGWEMVDTLYRIESGGCKIREYDSDYDSDDDDNATAQGDVLSELSDVIVDDTETSFGSTTLVGGDVDDDIFRRLEMECEGSDDDDAEGSL